MGNQEAARALVERYYPRVHSFVSYLTSVSQADDLTQEVFLRALGALSRFNGTYKFESWILRIARNLVIDELRKQSNIAEPTDPEELAAIDVRIPSDQVWESVSQKHVDAMVRTALDQLPMRQRTALVLREIDGMSYSDIAEVLGTNDRGVEATLRRARQRFRMEIALADQPDLRTTCRRALRALAGGQLTGAADEHLKKCQRCQKNARSVKAADGLFGILPPFVGSVGFDYAGIPGWGAGRRTLGEMLRQVPQNVLTGPALHMLETAATLALAGAISVSATVGQAGRVASASSSLSLMQVPAVVASTAASPVGLADPQAQPLPVAHSAVPAEKTVVASRTNESEVEDPSLLGGAIHEVGALGLGTVNEILGGASTLTTKELTLPDLKLDLGEDASGTDPQDPISGLQSLLPPAAEPVALPRRRIFAWRRKYSS